jgi:hypothetical protein
MLRGSISRGSRGDILGCPARACASGSAARWFGARGDHSLLAAAGVGVVVDFGLYASGVADVVEPS